MEPRTKILFYSFLNRPADPAARLVSYVECGTRASNAVRGDARVAPPLREPVEAGIDTARGNVELLSKQTLVRKYILTEDEEERYNLLQAPLMRLFSSTRRPFRNTTKSAFLPDGYEDVRQTRPYIENFSEEEGDSDVFRALQSAGDEIYSTVYRNPDNRKISLFFGKPLIIINRAVDPVGVAPRLRGYVGLTVDLGEVESHVRDAVISDSGYLFATDVAGNTYFESSRRTVDDSMTGHTRRKDPGDRGRRTSLVACLQRGTRISCRSEVAQGSCCLCSPS